MCRLCVVGERRNKNRFKKPVLTPESFATVIEIPIEKEDINLNDKEIIIKEKIQVENINENKILKEEIKIENLNINDTKDKENEIIKEIVINDI